MWHKENDKDVIVNAIGVPVLLHKLGKNHDLNTVSSHMGGAIHDEMHFVKEILVVLPHF